MQRRGFTRVLGLNACHAAGNKGGPVMRLQTSIARWRVLCVHVLGYRDQRRKRWLFGCKKAKYQAADTPGYFVIEPEVRIRERPRIHKRLTHKGVNRRSRHGAYIEALIVFVERD